MKIVVLDGYTLNPGDLSWDALAETGELTVYDNTPPELVIERAEGAQIVLTNKTPLTDEIFAMLPDLKYVGVLATGYNVVDIESATRRGIVVTNIPAYSTDSVVQMTFALILELVSHVQLHNQAVHAGEWVKSANFCFWKKPLSELSGKTIGILGFGSIGKGVAAAARAFGMKVLANSRTHHTSEETDDPFFCFADRNTLFCESDILSLHCPLTEETKEIINRETIETMKSTAILINTARGGLIREGDLADALNCGRIAGAGLDVLSCEPPKADNPLLTAKNCIITPHIAWSTYEARQRLMRIAAENVKSFLAGKPKNVVTK